MNFEKGEKVALVGGGMLGQFFYIVTYQGEAPDDKPRPFFLEGAIQVKLDVSGMKGVHSLPEGFSPYITESEESLPFAGSSWTLKKISKELTKLPHGYYSFTPEEVIDCSDMGFFSPMNGPIVLKSEGVAP